MIGEPKRLPGGVELSVYRIVQEALTNVLKHADPTSVTVTLAFRDARLELEVVDDGTPATRRRRASAAGTGTHRHARARRLLGGELRPGAGRAAASASRRAAGRR